MFPIYRLQIREMIGRRKLWLVALLLALPLLLSWAAMEIGGLKQVKQDLDRSAAARRDPTLWHEGREILPTEIELFDGRIRLEDGQLSIDLPEARIENWTLDVRQHMRLLEDRLRWAGGFLSIDPERALPDELPKDFGELRPQFFPRGDEPPWSFVAGSFLFAIYCQAIAVLMALLYAAPLLNTELEAKTLPYLMTRPVPRWQIITGKYCAIATVLLPFHLLSLAGAWLLLRMPGGTDLLGAELASSVAAVLCYNALFILIGYLIPSRAMVVAVIYIVLEAFLSFVPALINRFTITYYVRTLAVNLSDVVATTDLPEEVEVIIGTASLEHSLAVLSGIVLAGLLFAGLLAANREYVVTEKA